MYVFEPPPPPPVARFLPFFVSPLAASASSASWARAARDWSSTISTPKVLRRISWARPKMILNCRELEPKTVCKEMRWDR